MSPLRVAVGLVLLALVFGACTSMASGDIDTQTGCTSVTTQRSATPSDVVMIVRADGCPAASDTVERLAAAVWHALRRPVDEVRLEVSGRVGHHPSRTAAYSRATLTARFGAGPAGPVTTPVQRNDSYLWLLLPAAGLITSLGAIALGRRTARTGTIVFFLLR